MIDVNHDHAFVIIDEQTGRPQVMVESEALEVGLCPRCKFCFYLHPPSDVRSKNQFKCNLNYHLNLNFYSWINLKVSI